MPEPVGAQISVLAPEAIFGQPSACAGVGASNEASNQRLTGSLNGANGVDLPVSCRHGAQPSDLRDDSDAILTAMSSENVEIVRRMLDHYMNGEFDQALFADREGSPRGRRSSD